MTKTEVQQRLHEELYTICDHFDIEIEDKTYTEAQYDNLKHVLLTLNEMGMDAAQMNKILAIGA